MAPIREGSCANSRLCTEADPSPLGVRCLLCFSVRRTRTGSRKTHQRGWKQERIWYFHWDYVKFSFHNHMNFKYYLKSVWCIFAGYLASFPKESSECSLLCNRWIWFIYRWVSIFAWLYLAYKGNFSRFSSMLKYWMLKIFRLVLK